MGGGRKMIRLYHGTNKRIEHPDCLAGRDNLDFGKGFYTTLLREHAEHQPNHQLCILNQALADKYLHFVDSIEL